MADDYGVQHLKRVMSEGQDERITAPAPVAKGNRADGDGPKPPKK